MAIKTKPKPGDFILPTATDPQFAEKFGEWFDNHPELAKHTAKTGRPRSGKQVVSLRLDPDVVEKFRATGKGWQARMNEALRKA